MADDDRASAWQIGSLTIQGQQLGTRRPGHNYTVDIRRIDNNLVAWIYEDLDPESQRPGPEHAIAELTVARGTLPRVLDVLKVVTDYLANVPEERKRLSNLEMMMPEDLGKREPL